MTASPLTARPPRRGRSAAPRPLLSRSPRRWPRAATGSRRAAIARRRCGIAASTGRRSRAVCRDTCDLYIGNRGHRVIGLVPRPRRRLFWLHNPARYLRKPRIAVARSRWYRPLLVTTGAYHAEHDPRLAAAMAGGRSSPTASSTGSATPSRASRRRRARSSPRTRCAGSTGCSICGSRGSGRRCRRPSCTSMPGRRSMAAASKQRTTMDAVLARADALRGAGRAPPRSGRPRGAGRGADRCAGDALSRRLRAKPSASRSPRRRRWACRRWCTPLGLGRRAGRRRRHRPGRRQRRCALSRRRSRCCATTRCGGAGTGGAGAPARA